MKTITDLPLKVMAVVLGSLSSLEDLVEAICTCRYFNSAFREHPSIPGSLMLSTFESDTLNLAVAAEQVSGLPKPRTADAVRNLVDDMTWNPVKFHKVICGMSLQSLYQVRSLESLLVGLGFSMARHAWRHSDPVYEVCPGYGADRLSLSPQEAFRIFRAIYRTQIFLNAFNTGCDDPDSEVTRQGQLWLLTSFAQFEIEQIACVHDYLEFKILEVCMKFFEHDVELGAQGADYTTLGDNPWTQSLMCRWVQLISNHVKMGEKARRDNIMENLKIETANLYHALSGIPDAYANLKNLARTSPRDNFDPDSGPPSAFDYANIDELMEAGDEAARPVLVRMSQRDYGLREMGYVMWDMERIKDGDIWRSIESIPAESSISPTDADFEMMRESWAERAIAWRSGESGAWDLNNSNSVESWAE